VLFNNEEDSFPIEKKKGKELFWLILTKKNREPLVKRGIITDVELFSLMEEYFFD